MAQRRDPRRLTDRAPDRTRPASTRPPATETTEPGNDTKPTEEDNPHADTPGHPAARGTLPMARHLTHPTAEEEIQALAAEALPMTVDQATRLARLLRLTRRRCSRAA